MSGANAIHGIILVGAVLVDRAARDAALELAAGLLATVLATVNLVGGFVVTDRMLEMFKGRRGRPPSPQRRTGPPGEGPVEHGRRAALPGRRGLLHPRPQGAVSPRGRPRRGNLIGAAGAAIALLTTFFSTDLKNLGWILVAIAVGVGASPCRPPAACR